VLSFLFTYRFLILKKYSAILSLMDHFISDSDNSNIYSSIHAANGQPTGLRDHSPAQPTEHHGMNSSTNILMHGNGGGKFV
jgi:hypothetical protein